LFEPFCDLHLKMLGIQHTCRGTHQPTTDNSKGWDFENQWDSV